MQVVVEFRSDKTKFWVQFPDGDFDEDYDENGRDRILGKIADRELRTLFQEHFKRFDEFYRRRWIGRTLWLNERSASVKIFAEGKTFNQEVIELSATEFFTFIERQIESFELAQSSRFPSLSEGD